MPRAYSNDVRWRIVWQKLFFRRCNKKVAVDLFVSPKTVQRIFRRYLTTGDVLPSIIGRPKATTTMYQHEEFMLVDMILRKSTFQFVEIGGYEIERVFGRHFSCQSLCSAMHRLGFTRKKVLSEVLCFINAFRDNVFV